MNKIGKIINVAEVLKLHLNEIGCYTSDKLLRYLSCNKGEVYVVFDDPNNIHFGKLCKIKEDQFRRDTLAAFDKTDKFSELVGYDLNAIVHFENYKYIIRLS